MITGKAQFEFVSHGKGRFKLMSGLVAQVGRKRVFIPDGTITNGASIPAIFRFLFDPFDPEYFKAAVVHDALVGEFTGPVRYHDIIDGDSGYMDWKEAAQFFRELMKSSNSPKWKRHLFYHAVMIPKRLRMKK